MTPEASQVLPVLRVLLVPGLGLGAESWSPTVRALQRGGALDCSPPQVVLLPGYGLPDRERRNLAPRVLARTVADQFGHGSRVLLVGLSAGCQVAVQVVPDGVAGLVLVGPTTDPRAHTWPRLVGRWVATARYEPIRQLPALVRQYRRTGLVTMVRAMDAARRDRVQDVLPLLSCPTLMLRGAHDRIAPEDWLISLTRRRDNPPADISGLRRAFTLSAGAHMVPSLTVTRSQTPFRASWPTLATEGTRGHHPMCRREGHRAGCPGEWSRVPWPVDVLPIREAATDRNAAPARGCRGGVVRRRSVSEP